MATTSLPIPLTGVPFPLSEFERRQQKVLAAMERAELDALLVTAHSHLRYLTGFPGYGGYFRPFPFILAPGHKPTFVVREYDVESVRAYSCIDEIVPYTHGDDFAKVCADVLRRYGLQSKRIGFELGCWNLAPADVSALQAQLPEMKIPDATRLVPSVGAVKTELELEVMRDAMRMTDLAVRTFQGSLREGVSEAEMMATIEAEVGRAGGETAACLLFGERTKLPHGRPTQHPIKMNEPAFFEVAASKHGYASGLVRCAVLGRHPETESLHALAVEVLETVIAAMKPGITAASVHAAGVKALKRSGRSNVFRQRTGYQTGVNWGERGDLSLEPGVEDLIESGMTLHIPNILFSESGYICGVSASVLVTERGAEPLSDIPYTLYRA
ncbi:MAG: aminopeptidase P family protein [Mesorhizobium sp.]|uniref:M24 family metallopeptidase n=1 Tax=Mesorhizobium sp. TaxID=1871066 RepID=UPI000FE9C5E0|nr:Xaa-Pro peptidase family protein [Mesorhizobium sp.]RWP25784.1 MAG: aminopeptidase P family protein [Mesorhizobium sp.]